MTFESAPFRYLRRVWEPEEEAEFAHFLAEGGSVAQYAAMSGRTLASVNKKSYVLRVRKGYESHLVESRDSARERRSQTAEADRKGAHWTEEEDRRLVETYRAGATALETAKALDRTVCSVQNRLYLIRAGQAPHSDKGQMEYTGQRSGEHRAAGKTSGRFCNSCFLELPLAREGDRCEDCD